MILHWRIRTGSDWWFSKMLRIRTGSDSILSDQDWTRTEIFHSPLISAVHLPLLHLCGAFTMITMKLYYSLVWHQRNVWWKVQLYGLSRQSFKDAICLRLKCRKTIQFANVLAYSMLDVNHHGNALTFFAMFCLFRLYATWSTGCLSCRDKNDLRIFFPRLH